MWLFLLISLYLMYLLYYNVIKNYGYWFQRGVRTINPMYWFRLYSENIIRANDSATILQDVYEKHQGERYVGLYQLLEPILLVFDPELIKQILVKDFNSFSRHDAFVKKSVDALWSSNVFAITSEEGWYDQRAILSSFFTSSKMRGMFPLMQECSDQFLSYLKSNKGEFEMEMKNSYTRYANDVLARTAFSVSCDSLNDKDEFYKMVREANDFSGFTGLRYIGYCISPMLMKLLNIKIYNEKARNFISSFIKESIKLRTENKGARPDLIQILVDARKASSEYNNESEDKSVIKYNCKLTDDTIIADSLGIFFAGVETVSTTLSYTCYELGNNPDVQEKLCDEIQETLLNCNGKLTYDALVSMKYLDTVVSEALRLHPPNVLHDRRCVKPYTIDDEKRLHVEKNVWVWIPFGAIHRDERYFPNAEQYNPDRFSDENKHNIKPYTYFPFGAGPRNCIGSRFGVLECKLLIVEILQRYEFIPIEKVESLTKLGTLITEAHPRKIWIGLKSKI